MEAYHQCQNSQDFSLLKAEMEANIMGASHKNVSSGLICYKVDRGAQGGGKVGGSKGSSIAVHPKCMKREREKSPPIYIVELTDR